MVEAEELCDFEIAAKPGDVVGIITIEDVIEELIGDSLSDSFADLAICRTNVCRSSCHSAGITDETDCLTDYIRI